MVSSETGKGLLLRGDEEIRSERAIRVAGRADLGLAGQERIGRALRDDGVVMEHARSGVLEPEVLPEHASVLAAQSDHAGV